MAWVASLHTSVPQSTIVSDPSTPLNSLHPIPKMVFRNASFIAVGIATLAASASATTVPDRSPFEVENRTTTTTGVRASIEASSKVYSYCGVDIVGNDQWVERYPNPSACLTNCLPRTGCNAATWTKTDGGTCYFKRLTGSGVPAIKVVPNAGAISVMRTDQDTPFQIPDYLSDTDMPGNDFTSLPAETGASCPGFCIGNEKCSAVTWSSYNGGTCWLKTKPSSYVRSPGSFSFIIPHERNPDSCFAYM
jgi:hypothetical protein